MRVQTLQKRPNAPHQDQWEEGRDTIAAEYRGSAIIERYIDPGRSHAPPILRIRQGPWTPNGDGILDKDESLDTYYKFLRVVNTKRFAPVISEERADRSFGYELPLLPRIPAVTPDRPQPLDQRHPAWNVSVRRLITD